MLYKFVNSINCFNLVIAKPSSNDLEAITAPSSKFFAFPDTTKADAEFNKTTFLKAFFLPSNNAKISFAFSSGSPPIISLMLAHGKSISDG